MDPKQCFLAVIVVESQGLPTMKCQAKCAKEICVGFFWYLGTLARCGVGLAVAVAVAVIQLHTLTF